MNQEILKKRNKKAKKSVPIIDIDDSSDDSDSGNHSSNRPVKCADTKRDFASATTINQLQRKPMHPNLISATTTESDFSSLSLPPRHPTSDTVPQNLKEGEKSKHEANQQHRVSPISHSTNQSNKIKSLVLWRRRLWPSLTAFYRILLRCHCKFTPASCLPPNTLTTDALKDLDKFVEMQEGELSLEWGAFWDPSSLQPLSLRFTRLNDGVLVKTKISKLNCQTVQLNITASFFFSFSKNVDRLCQPGFEGTKVKLGIRYITAWYKD